MEGWKVGSGGVSKGDVELGLKLGRSGCRLSIGDDIVGFGEIVVIQYSQSTLHLTHF